MDDKTKYAIQIELLHPQPGDMIVFRYDSDVVTIAETHAIWAYVKDKFPENPVIFLPKKLEVKSVDRDRIVEFLETIKEGLGISDE